MSILQIIDIMLIRQKFNSNFKIFNINRYIKECAIIQSES